MKYLFSFKGTMSRGRFNFTYIFTMLLYGFVDIQLPDSSILFSFIKTTLLLLICICNISVIVRRLHGVGYYGLDLLFALIPGYNIYLLFFKKTIAK